MSLAADPLAIAYESDAPAQIIDPIAMRPSTFLCIVLAAVSASAIPSPAGKASLVARQVVI